MNSSLELLHNFNYEPMKAKIELSHHDRDGEGNWKSVKPLVFVLDEVVEDDTTKKEKGRKKKTAPAITSKNFGAFVSVPAIKDADNMVLAWRCRPLSFICNILV